MKKVKYIKTKDGQIIVFPEALQHVIFKYWNPLSAGFIRFEIGSDIDETKYGITKKVECVCYGESESLGLKSDIEIDSKLATQQLCGFFY